MTLLLLLSIAILCVISFAIGRIYELRHRHTHWYEGFEEAKRLARLGKLDDRPASIGERS